MIYPFSLPAVIDMSDAQLDGQYCVWCPFPDDDPTIPVGIIRGVQVFGHRECAERHRI